MAADPGAWRHPSAGPYTNAAQVSAELGRYGIRTSLAVQRVVIHYGALLETRIKANASGRPGPRVVTGGYRRSIQTETTTTGLAISARVGTNDPRARRLEYGFVGADRLGRVYNQPPYAHFGPAVLKTEPEFLQALERAARG